MSRHKPPMMLLEEKSPEIGTALHSDEEGEEQGAAVMEQGAKEPKNDKNNKTIMPTNTNAGVENNTTTERARDQQPDQPLAAADLTPSKASIATTEQQETPLSKTAQSVQVRGYFRYFFCFNLISHVAQSASHSHSTRAD